MVAIWLINILMHVFAADESFIEQRRRGLARFLNFVMWAGPSQTLSLVPLYHM
jgi:hypothetical protein